VWHDASLMRRLVVILLVVAAGACGTSPAMPECSTGADCASGVCRGDGTCAPSGDGGALDAAPQQDSAPVCNPNHDGTISRAEVSFLAGVHENDRIAENATFATAGTGSGANRMWDLSMTFAGDHDVDVATLSMSGQWFASSFPNATYAAKLSDTQALLGVFQATDSALLLLGVVSPTDGPTRTILTYSPPVTVLQFPVVMNGAWQTTTTVSGQAQGVPGFYNEQYDTLADATGTLATPYGSFPVLRVRTTLTRTAGPTITITRTYTFVAECYGVVGQIVSQPDEPAAEFTSAAELRRLAP
jgi:hypothetical protein